jgi:hypothetical protein
MGYSEYSTMGAYSEYSPWAGLHSAARLLQRGAALVRQVVEDVVVLESGAASLLVPARRRNVLAPTSKRPPARPPARPPRPAPPRRPAPPAPPRAHAPNARTCAHARAHSRTQLGLPAPGECDRRRTPSEHPKIRSIHSCSCAETTSLSSAARLLATKSFGSERPKTNGNESAVCETRRARRNRTRQREERIRWRAVARCKEREGWCSAGAAAGYGAALLTAGGGVCTACDAHAQRRYAALSTTRATGPAGTAGAALRVRRCD